MWIKYHNQKSRHNELALLDLDHGTTITYDAGKFEQGSRVYKIIINSFVVQQTVAKYSSAAQAERFIDNIELLLKHSGILVIDATDVDTVISDEYIAEITGAAETAGADATEESSESTASDRTDETSDITEQNISAAGIPVRICNVLSDAGVTTVKQLIGMTESQIKSISRMGQKSYDAIIDALDKHGLSIAQDETNETDEMSAADKTTE